MNETKSFLALALSKAQGAIQNAKKDGANPAFKREGKTSLYATLASIWDACRSQLSENEIAVIQKPCMQDGVLGINTLLIHVSGEREEGFLPLSVGLSATAQQVGSAMTYARRYSLAAMVGVAPDDDDDGNKAQEAPPLVAKKSEPLKKVEKPLAERAASFLTSIEVCENQEELTKNITKGEALMGLLLSSLPAKHKEIERRISEQKEALSAA